MSVEDTRWTTTVDALSDRTHRHTIAHRGGTTLRWEEAIELWQTDRAFSLFFTAALAASPFSSFFWECPQVSAATLQQPFEFVIIQAPGFSRADPSDFAEHFRRDAGAATFTNLGGDATLVAPTGDPVLAPGAARASYGHIAAFCRHAPENQQLALWQAVGAALAARAASPAAAPVWLSTEGSGVPWLHIRMDSRPKYYHHRAYAQRPR